MLCAGPGPCDWNALSVSPYKWSPILGEETDSRGTQSRYTGELCLYSYLCLSVCCSSAVRDLWWNSGFWGLPWTWPKAPTGSHQGAFSGLGLSHKVRGHVWRRFFTFSEDIWISARIHLHFAHCPPGNLGLHNRMGSITGWDKVEATGSRVSDPGSLPFPPPQA